MKLSISFLRQCFDVDYAKGVLTWRARPRSHFATKKAWANINSRNGGTVAGYVGDSGYVIVMIGRRNLRAHRVIWALHSGKWPNQIDHINGCRADNRLENLRDVSFIENSQNQKRRSNNHSGVVGVCWDRTKMKWRAFITYERQHILLGYRASKRNAVALRKDAELKYGFHPNHGRAA